LAKGSTVLTLIGGACLFASCSVTHPTLDAASVERQIARQLGSRYSIPTPPVNCPSGVRDRAGQTFACQATIEGQTLHLTGQVTQAGGHFTIAPQEAIVSVSQSTKQLTQDIEKHARTTAKVDCGPRSLLVIPVGQTFPCTVTFPGQPPRPVTVKVVDVQGDFGYTVAPAPK
jgi:hypothetical protein